MVHPHELCRPKCRHQIQRKPQLCGRLMLSMCHTHLLEGLTHYIGRLPTAIAGYRKFGSRRSRIQGTEATEAVGPAHPFSVTYFEYEVAVLCAVRCWHILSQMGSLWRSARAGRAGRAGGRVRRAGRHRPGRAGRVGPGCSVRAGAVDSS